MLAFQLAHARARDAVQTALDLEKLGASLPSPCLFVQSAAPDREQYLQKPDLGRRLADRTSLPQGAFDLAIVVADGLSATAVHRHAPALVEAIIRQLKGWSIAPVVIAKLARVALGDEIGQALGARLVLMLIGERPGLSAPDSLGAYLTWSPRPGRRDSERNCVSNIRSPDGLSAEQGAQTIVWLLSEAARLQFTGVELKDRKPALTQASFTKL